MVLAGVLAAALSFSEADWRNETLVEVLGLNITVNGRPQLGPLLTVEQGDTIRLEALWLLHEGVSQRIAVLAALLSPSATRPFPVRDLYPEQVLPGEVRRIITETKLPWAFPPAEYDLTVGAAPHSDKPWSTSSIHEQLKLNLPALRVKVLPRWFPATTPVEWLTSEPALANSAQAWQVQAALAEGAVLSRQVSELAGPGSLVLLTALDGAVGVEQGTRIGAVRFRRQGKVVKVYRLLAGIDLAEQCETRNRQHRLPPGGIALPESEAGGKACTAWRVNLALPDGAADEVEFQHLGGGFRWLVYDVAEVR